MNSNKPFAVLRINSKQHLVREGDTLKMDRISVDSLVEVLVSEIDGRLEIGEPVLENIGVEVEIVEQKKDKKISVRRFRSKSRYRKNKGHRQPVSILRIKSIKVGKSKIIENLHVVEDKRASQEVVKKLGPSKQKVKENRSIDSLEITDRMKNLLKAAGYSTVSDLKKSSKEELLAIKGVGEKALEKLLFQLK